MTRVLTWSVATRLWLGEGALERWSRQAPRVRSALLLVDEEHAQRLHGRALLAPVTEAARAEHVTIERHPAAGTTVDAVLEAGRRWRAAGYERILAVGGGATLDLAVLASLPERVHRLPAWTRGRSGLTLLPATGEPMPERVLIPTTLGTGAEVSCAACCDRDGEKTLWLGAALRPDEGICDPRATAGLPASLVGEAALEILARLLVPFAGPGADGGELADALALATLGCVVRADDALALATAGAHSHAGWVHLGRSPFASPVWYLATEVSAALGLRKAPATALVLPAWAAAVLAGERAWGDAARLRRAWAAVGAAAPFALPDDPVAGLRVLGSRWAPAEVTHAVDPVALAARCARRWGAGLPMLGALDTRAIAAVLADALNPARLEAAA